MSAPHVLIVLDTCAASSRGILRGFAQVAREQGWIVLHYQPGVDIERVASEWSWSAAVLGPSVLGAWPAALDQTISVAVNMDRSAEGVASVCIDERRVAELALAHFFARGLRTLTTFTVSGSTLGTARERAFREAAERAGARLEPAASAPPDGTPRADDRTSPLASWLSGLRKPCGVFACRDAWAHVVTRHARVAGLRVPEDIAILGVDNDPVECEITAPPLSSVAVPWRALGERAAQLVLSGLKGKPIAGQRTLIDPLQVVSRRSSDTFAVDDPLVAAAVTWIHGNKHDRLTVPGVARALGTTRQRLERRFRRALGRTVMQEARRARVEAARQLLASTNLSLHQVARMSGFTSAALLSVAFRTETGVPPGTYRRRTRQEADVDVEAEADGRAHAEPDPEDA
jgi:LacI family transcriptional regulator